MDQAVGAREDLDEGAEVDDLPHRAAVDLPDLGFGGDATDRSIAFCMAIAVGGGNVHRAVVLDVDLDAGLLDDAADDLPAGPDQVADAIRLDVDRDDPRRVGR